MFSSFSSRPAGLALACILAVHLAGSAAAAQERSLFLLPGSPSAVALSSGAANVNRPSDELQLNWELHFQPRDLRLFSGRLRLDGLIPMAGVMAAANGSLYGYTGARIERPLGAGSRWVFAPSFAAGLYYRDDGKELGGTLEFRSGLELSYRLGPRQRLGAVVFHLSNGGLNGDNPGTESLLLTYCASLR